MLRISGLLRKERGSRAKLKAGRASKLREGQGGKEAAQRGVGRQGVGDLPAEQKKD
jgi:hypothetical protein